jgi:hypothetical protein
MAGLTATGGVTGPGRIGGWQIDDLLKRAAACFPDGTAVTDGERRVTYTEIERDGSMDSGPAHPSRLLPTWTMILPKSGKPEFGDASTMCNCTSGNDE